MSVDPRILHVLTHSIPTRRSSYLSFGRPWRYGVVSVGIGASGLPSLIDRRGELDRDGRKLEVTQIALADMIATAAGLAAGEGAESIPAVLVRGYPLPDTSSPASVLVRSLDEDLFPRSEERRVGEKGVS